MPRLRSSSLTGSASVLALAAITLAACGGGGGSDNAQIATSGYAKAIAASVLQQHHQVVKVKCPPKVPRQKGHQFTCDVLLQVGTYPVSVTEVDDKGSAKYANSAPLVLLDSRQVEHAIGVEIRHQRHLGSDVTCPKQILQKQGVTFFCTAKVEDGVTTRFRVQQTDDKGNVKFVGL